MTTNNRFTIQIQPMLSDATHSFRLYRASMTPDNYESGIAFGVFSLLFGGLIFFIRGSWLTGIMLSIFIVFGVFAIFDLFPSIILWLQFRQNKDYYSKPYNMTFSNEEIEIQGKNIDARYKWNFFKDGVEGRKEFILVYGKMLYLTIPKHVFRNEKEIETFRLLLKEKHPNFKQKLKIWLDFQK